MPVIDFAPTRIFRQIRPPARPAVVVVDPDARGVSRAPSPSLAGTAATSADQLAHPRLVRRTRPPRAGSRRDFDDEPTGIRS